MHANNTCPLCAQTRTSSSETCWDGFIMLQVLNSFCMFWQGKSMHLTTAHIYDDATQWSGYVARGFNDAMFRGLSSICHSKVGHLFPEEAYSDKGQGRDKDRPITGWKIGWDRVNIWAWKSVCLCIWVSNFPFVLKTCNPLIWHQFLSKKNKIKIIKRVVHIFCEIHFRLNFFLWGFKGVTVNKDCDSQ